MHAASSSPRTRETLENAVDIEQIADSKLQAACNIIDVKSNPQIAPAGAWLDYRACSLELLQGRLSINVQP